MSGWTAVLPIKLPDRRKTRLADRLSLEERVDLSEAMLDHVRAVLARTAAIARIATLSAEPLGELWLADRGRGLNRELADVAHAIPDRLLVLHPDLPAIEPADLEALLAEAGGRAAIATDRHRRGTNALALAVADPACFAFGPDSLAAHRVRLPGAAIVCRDGLAFDVDTPEDLAEALRRGIVPGSFAPSPH